MKLYYLNKYILSILLEADRKKQKTQVIDKQEPDLSAYEKTKDDFDLSAYEKSDTSTANLAKIKTGTDVQKLAGKKQTANQTARIVPGVANKLHRQQAAVSAAKEFLHSTQDITDKISDADIAAAMQAAGIDNVADVVGAVPTPPPMTLKLQPLALMRIVKDIANRHLKEEGINVKWHEIRHLPGYAIQQLRAAFRPLFQMYIDNELEDIEVATTLTSPLHEIQKLVRHASLGGKKVENFSLEAFGIDPELFYIETAHIVRGNDGMTYFIMREKLGDKHNFYVYRGKTKTDNKRLRGKF